MPQCDTAKFKLRHYPVFPDCLKSATSMLTKLVNDWLTWRQGGQGNCFSRRKLILVHEMASLAFSRLSELAIAYGLFVYDVAYLELAQRLSLPLATLDEDLIRAAKAVSVTLLARRT